MGKPYQPREGEPYDDITNEPTRGRCGRLIAVVAGAVLLPVAVGLTDHALWEMIYQNLEVRWHLVHTGSIDRTIKNNAPGCK